MRTTRPTAFQPFPARVHLPLCPSSRSATDTPLRTSLLPAPSVRLAVALLTLTTWLLLCAAGRARAEETDPVSVARETVEEGDRFFARGLVRSACTQYGLAAATAPEWWYPAYKKALCDLARGQVRNAFYLLSRATLSGEKVFYVHLALARWYSAQGLGEKALDEYETALATNKGSVEALLDAADLLIRMERPGDALLLLRRAEHHAPSNLAVQHRLARVCEKLRYLRSAESSYRYLARAGVNRRRDLAELSRFYSRNGDPERAELVLALLKNGTSRSIELPPARESFPGSDTMQE